MGNLARYSRVQELLDSAVQMKIGSGIAASFGSISDLRDGFPVPKLFAGKTGFVHYATPVTNETVFDLASLTKILATTTLAMVRYEKGLLDLDAPLSKLLPSRVAANTSLAPITIRHLLTHSSGLPAWKPIYEDMKNFFGSSLFSIPIELRKEKFREYLYQVPRENAVGEKVVYSDLGFLILEDILSPSIDCDVGALYASIPNCHLQYRPVVTDARDESNRIRFAGQSVMMTEMCPWRGLLQGQVHDDNAWSLGGIAGHAGLFGTLSDVNAWIAGIFSDVLVSRSTLQTFFSENETPPDSRRSLGFDLPALDGSGSVAHYFSKNSVGHLGFTGTSLWIDLDSGDYAVLLINRVHPSRDDLRVRDLRREFHGRVREN